MHMIYFPVGMSHSSLAVQWESVGTIRDKARNLSLVSCLCMCGRVSFDVHNAFC